MRAERLRRTKDIRVVRERGQQQSDRHFSIRAAANDRGVVRVAVASPRSIGGAVARNRARRRVREAIRVLLRERVSAPGTDIFVVARPPALDASADDLRAAVRRQLEAVLGSGR